ncbi:MAG TPA: M67 family metallopeptidase [Urbifossiella sp.]|nr:M67 family metallopeptidase [Urbifossiella sp.]
MRILIPRNLLNEAIAQARSALPNECIGLFAGTIADGEARIEDHYPIRNDLASPKEYFTNPRDMLDAMRSMRESGTEVLAIYHSHPASPPIPSQTDIARNSWGETFVHIIIGLGRREPEVRGWWLGEVDFREADLAIDG